MKSGAAWGRALSIAFAAGALALLVVYLIEQRGYIAQSWAIGPATFASLCALVLGAFAMRGLANRSLFQPLGVSASTLDWLGVVSVHSLANYLPLQAGVFAKAFVLKRLHELPYPTFAAAEVALLLAVISTYGAVGLLVLAVFLPGGVLGWPGLVCAGMTASAVVLAVPERWLEGISRWFRWDVRATPGLRRAWPAVLAWQIAALLVTALALLVAFRSGDASIPFAACVLLAACGVAARVVSIVPGAVGVREFWIGALAHLAGFEFRDAVIASTLFRGAEIAVVFSVGGLFAYLLSREVARAPDRSP